MSASMSTRWWWLRHAPVPDPEGRITGNLDLPCDTSESDCFKMLASRLPLNPLLVESGLIRCSQTIGALEGAGMVLPPALVEPDLAEQDFGRWQGHSWNELATAKDPDLEAFWRDPSHTAPPAGESFADVIRRVSRVIERLNREHAGRDILVVAHAGSIRAALALALDISPESALRFGVEPLSLTRMDSVAGGWRVAGTNSLPF